ncbi:MAG: TrkH family potassium uptake protein, partial [Halocynthiibacter sp.]
TFLLTTGVWLALPLFGALPFLLGATEARFVDAFFEAMSGLTTTGSTVFSGLEELPRGLLLWRSMLQWFGGIGIIVVAMVFLPELRIGGMQIFQSEAFDTMGKILPRAVQIATRISAIYVGLTLAGFLAYVAVGMGAFDALNHALTTLSTGGFSTRDASFGAFRGAPEYVASVFMVLAALPFVLYVQMVGGAGRPLFRDSQVRAFIGFIFCIVVLLTLYRILVSDDDLPDPLRESIFNTTSIVTGTGYASVDYQLWGTFPVVIFFFIGLVGGCAGSTTCSIKIFRYQLFFASVRAQIRKIHSPHGIFTPRYQGRAVSEDVLSSVMSFFVFFVVTLGLLSVLLGLTGLDAVTSVSGAAAALANIGPGLGPEIGPKGNYSGLNDPAKWILTAAMLIGRLELMAVYVLLTIRFWRG